MPLELSDALFVGIDVGEIDSILKEYPPEAINVDRSLISVASNASTSRRLSSQPCSLSAVFHGGHLTRQHVKRDGVASCRARRRAIHAS
jgi:hypothetical protein